MPERHPIRLLLADVDGTLVTQEKVLTDRAIAAVRQLGEAGILFAVTSGRPPRGMAMLVDPLQLSTPIAAFNGGLFANPDMSVIEQRTIPDDVTPEVIDVLDHHGVDVWVYRGSDWFVRDPKAPHVDREAWTVKFDPTPIDNFASVSDGVAKVVGVSDDLDAVKAAVEAVHDRFGDHLSRRARSRTTPTSRILMPTRAGWSRTSRSATAFHPQRSPRSETCRTTCSCSNLPATASPWATPRKRCSGPPAT